MPDVHDRDAEIAEAQLENALLHHAHRPRSIGRRHCENQDCGEPISESRCGMGARLCVPCATADEQRECQFSRRGVV
jgi:hypothetical protein